MNVFKTLKLNPDNINLEKIENYLKKIDLNVNNEELIEDTSLRFQFLEELEKCYNIFTFEASNAILLCIKSLWF